MAESPECGCQKSFVPGALRWGIEILPYFAFGILVFPGAANKLSLF
jgi:hypothetical protein